MGSFFRRPLGVFVAVAVVGLILLRSIDVSQGHQATRSARQAPGHPLWRGQPHHRL